jgi:two-component system OmpR family response regulator
MAKILVAEDNSELKALLSDWLISEGHVVDALDNGLDTLEYIKQFKYDLIVLDWELPGLEGIEICRRFRQAHGTTPILFLTVRDKIQEKEVGFGLGADDYLTKPFHMRELSLRVRALLRRPPAWHGDTVQVDDLILDRDTHKAKRNGTEITLMPREFALLEFLMRRPDEIFSAEVLLNSVWSSDSETGADTVRMHIMRLRRKIDTPGCRPMIKTVHRSGYVLESGRSSMASTH